MNTSKYFKKTFENLECREAALCTRFLRFQGSVFQHELKDKLLDCETNLFLRLSIFFRNEIPPVCEGIARLGINCSEPVQSSCPWVAQHPVVTNQQQHPKTTQPAKTETSYTTSEEGYRVK